MKKKKYYNHIPCSGPACTRTHLNVIIIYKLNLVQFHREDNYFRCLAKRTNSRNIKNKDN